MNNRFPRLHQAIDYAANAHNGQLRKGTSIPYLAHLMGVCALVLEYGGDEDQTIAAVLHDVIEDCGEQHREAVRIQFGDRVAEIIEGCTDGVPDAFGKKALWRERKETYIQHLAKSPPDTLLVSACDKLYNARAIVSDLRTMGLAVFDKFSVPREQTIWYYDELLAVFESVYGLPKTLVSELKKAIYDMKLMAF